MKRSEMIKILSRALICQHVILYEGVEECFVPKAEHVLELLENNGMLPPFSHEVFERNWNRLREASPGGNEWDKEDEN